MKMVKSLLLGSAAGLVAVAGAQAADLPVKAKPVEYVKVCSLYGAGYYYMPGTDICLKLGGYVRYQFTVNPGSSVSFGPFFGAGGRHTRTESQDTAQRVRALITVDTRQQTAYGTLRTYVLLGYTHDTNNAAAPLIYFTRGFIQVAGFTLGKASSFFDIYPNASFGYNVGLMAVPDTGDGGQVVAGYTAQFGNGVSLTIAIEQARAASVVNTTTAASFAVGALPTSNNLGGPGVRSWPDIVGNLRVDQAWGSILIAAALHDASGGYYGATVGTGHPSNEWGWAATIGAIFNLPFIAPGDRFAFQFVYSEGAVRYAALNQPTTGLLGYGSTTVGFGFATDGVYGATPSGVELTTAWSIAAAIEHLWTPALRTSLYGSYLDVSHNAAAKVFMCANGTFLGGGAPGGALCNPDFSYWVIGSRTQWSPVRGWIMGVDVIYSNLDTANTGTGIVAANGNRSATPVGDQSAWTFTFRTQRDYHP